MNWVEMNKLSAFFLGNIILPHIEVKWMNGSDSMCSAHVREHRMCRARCARVPFHVCVSGTKSTGKAKNDLSKYTATKWGCFLCMLIDSIV